MSSLVILFVNNLLPIFLVAGAGLLIGKKFDISPRSISRVTFYLFSPCLLFNLIMENEVSGPDILRMLVFASLIALIVGLFSWGVGRLLRLDRRMLSALLITSILINAGNLGLPLVKFAFGDEALSYAALYFVANVILTNTAGIFIASMGTATPLDSLRSLLKVPAIYMLAIALVIKGSGWMLPVPLERAMGLLGDAAIPGMLVVLGLQFQKVRWSGQSLALGVAYSARMLLAPALAILLCPYFGFTGAARQAAVLESAAPAAVLGTILATEYDVEPSFVTMVVFFDTLVSPLTLTPLLAYLGAG